jgi:integrase
MPAEDRTATGHLREMPRKGGHVFYAKLKIPRPDGTYYEPQRRLGKVWTKRSRPPAGYLTRGMAQARLAAILGGDDPLVNVEPPAATTTFGQACDEHLRYMRDDRQRKPSTVRDATSTITAHLLPHFGASTPVRDITTADIEAYRDKLLSRGLAHRTAQKILTLLGGILARAKRKGWIDANPMDDVEKVVVRVSDEFNVLSVEQVQAVADAAHSAQLSALFRLAAFTGLRQGELLALRWQHVDAANRILHVRRNLPSGTFREDTPKSHRRRSVPLSDQALAALQELAAREHFTAPEDLLFPNPVGRHLLDDKVRDAFYAALDAAGLGALRDQADPIVFHDLRHTFGTTCAARGIDLLKIKQWMGHADVKTTMRYLHYVPKHDDAALLTAAFTRESVPRDMPRTADIGAQPSATRGSKTTA